MKRILVFLLFGALVLTLSACTKEDLTFFLIGDSQVSYTLGQDYEEKGFIALDEYSQNIEDYVTVTHNIDNTTLGDYTITYTLDYNEYHQTLERTVHYRENGCTVIPDTDITQCSVSHTQYLNTYVTLKFYYSGDALNGQAQTILDNVESILADYHKLSNKYKSFEGYTNVRTINDNPTATHSIDPRLFDIIEYAIHHQDEVNGMFNIALGPVLKIWHNYREDCNLFGTCAVPLLEDLEAANQYTDVVGITLDPINNTITMEENMSIDLGGMSKGYISQVISDYLNSVEGLDSYILNNGESNISIGGTHPIRESGRFILAISDPTGATPYYAAVGLQDGDQLVTSGDNQQFFMVDGDLYHHIINPNTLFPERYARSVSIITSNAALADIYSTAIFNMTLEDGMEFVNNTDDLEAIWYGLDDTIHYSANFEKFYIVEIE